MAWSTKQQPGSVDVRISMGTTDKDVLDRLAAIVGVGSVRAVTHQLNKLGTKPIWHWHCAGKSDVRELATRLRPWLGIRRREQVDKILACLTNIVIQPVGICGQGHRIEGRACRECINARRRARGQATPYTRP